MAGKREIRSKIDSVKNTKKIIQAMELVSASKMKKSKKIMSLSVPYEKTISNIINHILLSSLDYEHIFFEKRKIKNVGYIIISTDRGLCGSLNNNLFKKVLIDIKYWNKKNVQYILSIVGTKGVSFFNSINFKIFAQTVNLGEKPSHSNLIRITKTMLTLYKNKKIDKLFLIHNKFFNIISQKPHITELLPISLKDLKTKKNDFNKMWSYLYEPDSKKLIDVILNKYIEFQVYQKVLENIVSEQAARTFSMKTANDNAEDLMKDLLIFYNKTRQANITKELIEIISGSLNI